MSLDKLRMEAAAGRGQRYRPPTEPRASRTAMLVKVGIVLGAIAVIVLFMYFASVGGKPVNTYGDDAITASVRAGYTNQAQATLHPAPATPIPVRIVP